MVLSPTTTSLPQTDSKINSLLKTLPGFEHNKNNNSNSFLGKEISFPLRDTLYPDLSITKEPIFIKSLLRRISQDEGEVIKIGSLTIDRSGYKVSLNGKDISLPRKEFELLFLLGSKPGKVFKREFILESVWGKDVVVGDRTIDVHIRKLREKIGDSYFKTIKGVGYKFQN